MIEQTEIETSVNNMSVTTQELYTAYCDIMQKAADLNNASAVLGWDQEVYMPPKSATMRARQLATLATEAHSLLTSEKLDTLLNQLAARNDLAEDQRTNVELSLKDLNKNKKLPAEFVDQLSRQTSECFNAWIDARKKNDFSVFAPSLAKMIELKKKQVEYYGYAGHPYNALLDDYEEGATVEILDRIFAGIRANLPPILHRIQQQQQVSDDCFHSYYPKQLQWDFSIDVLKHIGFDFEAGRQDYSEHPFTTSFSSADVRLTTRVDEFDFASMLWSCIHEGGHGLYEQGLPADQYGLPLGAAVSLGIHESQSRLWENCVGRGNEFWTFFYPRLQELFPEQLSMVTKADFVKAANRVTPSLIRTEADELTYHFHVMIRYEIEKGLIEGSLLPGEIPGKWNELYEHYLGVTPADDKTGALQDVHWSHGSFGYFPTYTLGSFYAAQFYAQAVAEVSGLEEQMAKGDFSLLLDWLREEVHMHGRKYNSERLCELITGKPLDPQYFISYITEKYQDIYSFC